MTKLASITIRGVTYPTVAHAAQALGVSKDTVRSAKCRGRLDSLGVGSGNGPGAARANRPRPITVAGHTFPSRVALSRAVGMRDTYVHDVLRSRSPEALALLLQRVLAWASANA